MPQILDVVIGTIFVFLLFSLVVAAFNELILSYFDMRAKFLHKGLQELLGEGKPNTGFFSKHLNAVWMLLFYRAQLGGVTKKLCEHGLINALSRSDKSTGASPSYIPAGAFVMALFDILRKEGGIDPTGNTIEAVDEAISKLKPTSKLREGLLSLRAHCANLAEFEAAVEGWFNASMDRVSGWYKRFSQNWMILIGFAVAAVLNVDTIHIVQVLSQNQNLARAVAAQAEAYKQSNVYQGTTSLERAKLREDAAQKTKNANNALIKAKENANIELIGKAEAALKEAQLAEFDLSAENAFRNAVADLSVTALPIGWGEAAFHRLALDRLPPVGDYKHQSGWDWIWKPCHHIRGYCSIYINWALANPTLLFTMLAGWLLTAIAGSIGAPFWFDLLGRFINIRASGRAPGQHSPSDSPGQPSLDRISPA